jgi:hypothetical protein
MNLKLATLEYVALKQSMGMRFETEAALLRSFVKEMGLRLLWRRWLPKMFFAI